MRKILIIVLAAAILFAFIPVDCAYASEIKAATDALEELDLSPFEGFLEGVDGIFQGKSFKEKVSELLSGKGLDFKEYLNVFLSLIFSGINEMLPLMVTLFAVIILYGVLGIIKSNFLSDETKKIISAALMLSIMVITMTFMTKIAVNAKSTMENLKSQMFAGFPVFLTLLFASGGTATTAALQPVLYFFSVIISDLIIKAVFPLFLFSICVNLLSSLSPDVKFGKAAEFAKTLSNYIIGVSFTVFTAVLAISGVFAGGYDGVLYKTAKYAVGSSVPIVGGYIKDGLDLVILTSVQIKNTVGIAALLVFLGTAIKPIVSSFVAAMLLKGVAAVSESFADGNVGGFLDKTAKGLETVGASVTAVTFMYMESVFMLILATNIII